MWGAQAHQIHLYNTTPVLKAQGTPRKREQKDCKNQRTRTSVVMLCLLEMTGKLNPQHPSNMAAYTTMNNKNTNRHVDTEDVLISWSLTSK